MIMRLSGVKLSAPLITRSTSTSMVLGTRPMKFFSSGSFVRFLLLLLFSQVEERTSGNMYKLVESKNKRTKMVQVRLECGVLKVFGRRFVKYRLGLLLVAADQQAALVLTHIYRTIVVAHNYTSN